MSAMPTEPMEAIRDNVVTWRDQVGLWLNAATSWVWLKIRVPLTVAIVCIIATVYVMQQRAAAEQQIDTTTQPLLASDVCGMIREGTCNILWFERPGPKASKFGGMLIFRAPKGVCMGLNLTKPVTVEVPDRLYSQSDGYTPCLSTFSIMWTGWSYTYQAPTGTPTPGH